MKLRFVKFLTSRENEIEKKEEGGPTLRAPLPPARPRPEPMLCLPPPSTISVLFLPPPTSPHPPSPSFPSATCRESNILQLSISSCSASPFLLHEITEATERGGRGTQLADPAVLSNDSMAGAQLAAPLPLPVARLYSTVSASSRLQARSIHIERSHRKTKTENGLSCFITFIDE